MDQLRQVSKVFGVTPGAILDMVEASEKEAIDKGLRIDKSGMSLAAIGKAGMSLAAIGKATGAITAIGGILGGALCVPLFGHSLAAIIGNATRSAVFIKIIGLGGAGCHAVEHMIASGVGSIPGVEFICVDSDALLLSHSRAHKTILLGVIDRNPDNSLNSGRKVAEEKETEIRNAIDGAQIVFMTAGMGGRTGTDAALVFARIAGDMGILTVGVVTMPFEFEGDQLMKTAIADLADMQSNVDSLMVVPNEKLRSSLPDGASQSALFACSNNMLKTAVGSIAEIINVPGHVDVDIEDVKGIMGKPGRAMLGTALASGQSRGRIAAEGAVACPMLEGIELSGAKGLLVIITAARGKLKLSDSKLVINTVRAKTSPDVNWIYGTTFDDSLNDEIRVTVVVTGLNG